MTVLDVSAHQGAVAWEKLAGKIGGVMLRAGYGAGNADREFQRNAEKCNRLGIPCGAYWFSYATSADEAAREAAALLEAVGPYRMELPLAFDFEYDSLASAARRGVTVDALLAGEIARTFLGAVEAAGYYALLYANPDFLSRYFAPDLPARYGLWLAHWGRETPSRPCQLWQKGTGTFDGVDTPADVNEAYVDFPTLLRSRGLNRLPREYADGEGGVIVEFAAGEGAHDAAPALAWLRGLGLAAGASPDAPVTWGDLAGALYALRGRSEEPS